MISLADFDYNLDLIFEHLQAVIDQVITSSNPHSLMTKYFEAKQLCKEILSQQTDFNELRINEQLHYDILDHLLAFYSANINPHDVQDLATMLSIDTELKKYCVIHVLGEGVFAQLKYDLEIPSKVAVIKSALTII